MTSMIGVTPLSPAEGEFRFAIASSEAGKAKVYGYPTRKDALKARGVAIKTFKDNGFTVVQ